MWPGAYWVDATHHVADRPVLARRIECLKNDEDAVRALSCEPRLVLRQQPDPVLQEVDTAFLLLDPRLEAGIEILASFTLEPGALGTAR